jgi:hypothetical protein
VILGSAKGADAYGWLQFDEPTYQPEFGCTCTFVRAENETSVTFTMLDHYRDALLDFINALERPDPESDVPLVWESEDSDVRLTVASDGQQATIGCVMRWSPEWVSRNLGMIKVEAADLRSFAHQMRAFVTGP